RNSDNWLSFMAPANKLNGLAFSRPGNTPTELFHGAILYNESALPDAMEFRTGGNLTRLTITGTGSVGIGTTAPDNTLHVQKASAGAVIGNPNAPLIVENGGNTYINILSPDANESGILFGKPAGGSVAGGIIYDNSATLDGLQFRTNGNATRMAIDASGHVG